MEMIIESSAFEDADEIPQRYTGDGKDVSPPLSWAGLPEGTKELAIICDDPDAPTVDPWVHWVIYKIAPEAPGLTEGLAKTATLAEPAGALQGKNTWETIGYRGPAPPTGHGTHNYSFRLYALDAPLDVRAGLGKKSLLAVMVGHILAEAELIGTYER